MNASISVFAVIYFKCGQDAQLNPRCIAVLLHGSNDLNSDGFVAFPVMGLDDLAKSALSEQSDDLIY
jgi:hypothetical protein